MCTTSFNVVSPTVTHITNDLFLFLFLGKRISLAQKIIIVSNILSIEFEMESTEWSFVNVDNKHSRN